MDNPQWPTTPKPRINGTSDELYMPVNKSEFEANYTQISPSLTRDKMKFTLSYENITIAEFEALKAFCRANKASYIDLLYPADNQVYTVYLDLSNNILKRDFKSVNIATTTITLSEV